PWIFVSDPHLTFAEFRKRGRPPVIWRIRFSKPKLIDRNGPGASLSRDLFKVRRKLQNRCGATKERSRMTFEESSGKVFGDIGFRQSRTRAAQGPSHS